MEHYMAGDRRLTKYQSSLPALFAAILVLYTIGVSPHERLLERLLERLHESLFESLLESLLERASHWKESSFPREALGRWKTQSLWKLWLIEGSRSVEALASRRL